MKKIYMIVIMLCSFGVEEKTIVEKTIGLSRKLRQTISKEVSDFMIEIHYARIKLTEEQFVTQELETIAIKNIYRSKHLDTILKTRIDWSKCETSAFIFNIQPAIYLLHSKIEVNRCRDFLIAVICLDSFLQLCSTLVSKYQMPLSKYIVHCINLMQLLLINRVFVSYFLKMQKIMKIMQKNNEVILLADSNQYNAFRSDYTLSAYSECCNRINDLSTISMITLHLLGSLNIFVKDIYSLLK